MFKLVMYLDLILIIETPKHKQTSIKSTKLNPAWRLFLINLPLAFLHQKTWKNFQSEKHSLKKILINAKKIMLYICRKIRGEVKPQREGIGNICNKYDADLGDNDYFVPLCGTTW